MDTLSVMGEHLNWRERYSWGRPSIKKELYEEQEEQETTDASSDTDDGDGNVRRATRDVGGRGEGGHGLK